MTNNLVYCFYSFCDSSKHIELKSQKDLDSFLKSELCNLDGEYQFLDGSSVIKSIYDECEEYARLFDLVDAYLKHLNDYELTALEALIDNSMLDASDLIDNFENETIDTIFDNYCIYSSVDYVDNYLSAYGIYDNHDLRFYFDDQAILRELEWNSSAVFDYENETYYVLA